MSAQLPSRTRVGLAAGIAATALAFAFVPLPAFAEEAAPAPAVVESSAPAAPVEAPDAEAAVAAEPEAAEAPAEPPSEAPAEPAAEPAEAPAEPADAPAVPPASEPVGDAASDTSAPVEVVVAEPDATVEETLAEEVDEPTVTLFAAEADGPVVAAVPAPGDPCYPAVCITNGTILLAVNPTGELNTSDATGSAAGPGDAGLAYLPTGNDSTSPGCLCEGWGVADPASGVWGGADLDTEGPGGTNLVLESFDSTGSTATSVVLVTGAEDQPVFRVTHEYVPSPATPNLYQVNVTIENMTGSTIATVQYRRVMDWDIEPTAFDEYVTIDGGSASALYYSSDDGFASPNPLLGPSFIDFEGNAVDNGINDHGALFDFAFGPLAPGGSLSFVIYYGAAGNEAAAVAALAAVGAEAYSFGQTADDPVTGTPNTFIFAFGKVGGRPLFGSPIEPAAPVARPAPAAVVPAAAVASTVRVEVADAASPTLASTGAESNPGILAAFAALLAGLALVVATTVARARRV